MASKQRLNEREGQLLLDAYAEFLSEGRSTIKCDECGGIIEFRALKLQAFAHGCPCGKYTGTMRGL